MSGTLETTPRVVVHLDEAGTEKHHSVLRNVVNLRAELGGEVPIAVVTHGPGVAALRTGSDVAAEVGALVEAGVEFSACANTLRALGLDSAALLPGVVVVPSGIAELVRRQQQGWIYLRP